MPMTISIRDATLSDANAIALLTGQLGYDVSSEDAAARLGRILSRPDQCFVIAEVDQRPAAWLHAAIVESIEADPFVMIAGLVVDRQHRRSGIGAALLRHAEQWATEQRCTLVRLWSSAARVATHRFYEHRGFINVKTQVSFVKPVGGAQPDLQKLVPRVEEQS
jgi:GNAT superfamily N-acetyltransferase